MDWIFTATFFSSVITAALCSNTEPSKTIVNDAAGFGYQVVQTPSGLLVSAPFEQFSKNKRGQIFSCTGTGCQSLKDPVPEIANMSLGLAMITDPDTNKIVACGPTVPKKCLDITKYSGVCLEMENGELQKPEQSSAPECQTKLDIVFLLDGSGSLSVDDFDQMKTFVGKLLDSLVGMETQFAVVQFGTDVRIHLNFKQFDEEEWPTQLDKVMQLKGFTKTATAMEEVLENVFTPSAGSRPDAEKILIVITDGKTTEPQEKLKKVLEKVKSRGISCFAIGIGEASTTDDGLRDLKLIASEPEETHMFKVESFEALDGIRQAFQDKLFSIEGSQAGGESLKMELSQEGFKAAVVPGGIQMTIVGANQWRGGYKRYEGQTVAATFEPMDIETDSYLGYSMTIAKTAGGPLTIIGAPRYEHKGLVVVVFEDKEKQKLEPKQRESQIGEYFGAEVCAMDVDLDSITDLIIISSPMYKESDREGRVYVCKLTHPVNTVDCHFESPLVLNGVASDRGSFGSSLAVLPDLDNNGFSDLAVGAPLENDGQGSVYIFYAEAKNNNIFNSKYSQRIPASDVQLGLKFFGMSISQSTFDQSGDGLPDIAVGSKGAVSILRTMPLVKVESTVSFDRNEIPTHNIHCLTPLKNVAKICFKMTRQSKVETARAQINYTITFDTGKKIPYHRAHINDKQQETGSIIVDLSEAKCRSVEFFITPCPEDIQNLLWNEFSFNFHGLPSDKNVTPSLPEWTNTTTQYPLKFQINYPVNETCEDNLKLDLTFVRSELTVGVDEVLDVIVSVENRGESSYNTSIALTYPPGLFYKKITAGQGRIECNSLDKDDGITRGKTNCSINKPVFRSNTKVFFTISYGIGANSQLGRKILVTANATSVNKAHSPSSKLNEEKEIAVKYNIFVSVKSYLNYCNFTFGKFDLLQPNEQLIEVTNNIRSMDLKVVIRVPVMLGNKKIWHNFTSLQIKGCQKVTNGEPVVVDFIAEIRETNRIDCSVAQCSVFNCSTSLERYASQTYAIAANLSSKWIEQIGLTLAKFELISTASLEYDMEKYFFHSAEINNRSPVYEVKTVVEVYPEPDFTKAIIGGCLGGFFLLILLAILLYKVGFFKSKYNEMLDQNGEKANSAEVSGLVGD